MPSLRPEISVAATVETVSAAPSDIGALSAKGVGLWLSLPEVVAEAWRRQAKAAEIDVAIASSDNGLRTAWIDLACATEGWDREGRNGVRGLADDVVSYAGHVADELLDRLSALIEPLAGRAPSADEARACAGILKALAVAAEDRAQRAGEFLAPIGHLLEAVGRFAEAFSRHVRNPAVRVVLPGVPGMCLSYDEDGLACVVDMKAPDPRQYWILEPSGDAYLLISAADQNLLLIVDQDERLISMTRTPPPFTFADRGPQPRVETRDKAAIDAARFFVLVRPNFHIQNVSYQTLALDCPGEGGWCEGASVQTTLKSGGANQRWSFHPPLRPRLELEFYDLVAPVGRLAQQAEGLRRLQGEWISTAEMLRAGAQDVVERAELSEPFIDAERIARVLEGWRRLAVAASVDA